MNEVIQLAITICPLVIIDIVDTDTMRFDFQTASGARVFSEELATLEGEYEAMRLDREVIVLTI